MNNIRILIEGWQQTKLNGGRWARRSISSANQARETEAPAVGRGMERSEELPELLRRMLIWTQRGMTKSPS